jgi:S1-C subfamily serine protease
MNATRRIALVVALLVVTAAASTALAEPRPAFFFDPDGGAGVSRSLPELGLTYRTIPGYGYRVQYTWYPSLAGRIGFEAGDVILSINGQRLSYTGAHQMPLAQAQWNGGWFWFAVQDVRTGSVITRWANLNR